MSLVSTKQAGLAGFTKYRSLADASGNPAFNIPGMVLMTDYTITHAGTSATLTNGQVTFTAVTSLSLNGVFSADFDNYVVAVSFVPSTALGTGLEIQLASGGTAATGTDYTYQRLRALSTTVDATRTTSATSINVGSGGPSTSIPSATHIAIYGPALAQPTATRNVSVTSHSDAGIYDFAGTHSLSTSYDGFKLFPSFAYSITGKLAVYGVRS